MCETRQIAERCGCACVRRRVSTLTATQKANNFLVVVGLIVLAGSARWLLHVAVVVLSVVLGVLLASWGVRTWWRRRHRGRVVVPAPLPGVPARTVVTGASVRAIGSPVRADTGQAVPARARVARWR